MSDPLADPRVCVDEYIVKPSCYDDLPEYERLRFCLVVTNGHKWGWSVRMGAGMSGSPYAMNRKGKMIYESRGHGGNKHRRYPLEEALALALKHVDTMKVNMRTAQEWVDRWEKEN